MTVRVRFVVYSHQVTDRSVFDHIEHGVLTTRYIDLRTEQLPMKGDIYRTNELLAAWLTQGVNVASEVSVAAMRILVLFDRYRIDEREFLQLLNGDAMRLGITLTP